MRKQPEPFVVKHYVADERPSLKGNGFDGLEIAETREDAEEFAAYINTLIEERALLLAALQQVRTALDGRDEYIDGCTVDAAIKKATT